MQKPLYSRNCKLHSCNKFFETNKKTKTFCCPAHAKKYRETVLGISKNHKNEPEKLYCIVCANEFETTRSFQQFCSKECRVKFNGGYTQAQIESRKRNIDKRREQGKRRRERNRDRLREQDKTRRERQKKQRIKLGLFKFKIPLAAKKVFVRIESRQWYQKNKTLKCDAHKKYYHANKEKEIRRVALYKLSRGIISSSVFAADNSQICDSSNFAN